MTLKYNIICTENYLLIVDDSQITEGDYTYHHVKGIYKAIVDGAYTNQHKIIAHLPLNNSPILEGVDLLPPLPDEAEMMAEKYSKNYYDDNAQDDVYHGFFIGYNKAKEKYKYTEEDLRKAIRMAREISWDESGYSGLAYEPNKIIQSLQQPKMPIGFNLEAKDTHTKNGVIIKSQWIGTWTFANV